MGPPRPAWLGRAAAAAVLVPWLVGALLLVVQPRPGNRQGCSGPLTGATLDHLGRCDHGATVEVSSEDLLAGHLGLWAVDGRVGSETEKWAAREKRADPAAWLIVWLPGPTTVARVVLHLGGEREPENRSLVAADVMVRQDGAFRTVAELRGNSASVATLTFPPVSTDAVRIAVREADRFNGRARIYEVELHGE